MIDLNDPQLNQHGEPAFLLTNKTFKDQIETGSCSSLKDAKYIHLLNFTLNIKNLQNNSLPFED